MSDISRRTMQELYEDKLIEERDEALEALAKVYKTITPLTNEDLCWISEEALDALIEAKATLEKHGRLP